ncbi:hypothetical protein ACUNV4_07330 [Granulosicoccus sp. 3-233]|uniref:hypothetical protein n=1 Tax=Granulosicoccus sp. 3-233 TaxID=3417969 RepID=UPI003D34AB2C
MAGRRFGRGWMLSLLVSSLLVVACERERAPDVVSGMQETAAGDETLSLTALVELAARQDADPVGGAIVYPADLRPHPRADAESFSLQALLEDEHGEQVEVQLRLDRLALERQSVQASAWEYSDVMRSSLLVAGPAATAPRQGQSVQRRALGLADSNETSLFVTATRIDWLIPEGLGDTVAANTSCHAGLRVTAALPAVEPAQATTRPPAMIVDDKQNPADGLGRRLELQLALDHCPDGLEVGDFRQWMARAVPVSASLSAPGDRRDSVLAGEALQPVWQGRAWLSNSWGALPSSGGAVVIDTLELYLESSTDDSAQQRLSVTRSKRRSGRGPETVQSRLRGTDGAARSVELRWTDTLGQRVSDDTHELPESIRIDSDDGAIALQLTPLQPPVVRRDIDGKRWRGAVSISGTHDGFGFADFQPVQRAD